MKSNINDYDAFLSYSHRSDEKFVPLLQRELHKMAKPWYRLRSVKIFLDKTSLAANPALWPTIEKALNSSTYFLLVASSDSAKSEWVERELNWWINHRSVESLIIILSEGDLYWDRDAQDFDWKRTTALPASLKGKFIDEPLYVDFRTLKQSDNLSIRNKVFRNALLDIAAPLHGKAKYELDGEDIRQQKRNKRWAWSAGLSIIMVAAVAGMAIIFLFRKNIETESGKFASESDRIRAGRPYALPEAVMKAAEALKSFPSLEADQAMYKSLALLGPEPVAKRVYEGLKEIKLSPQGRYIARIPYDGPAVIEETLSGKTVVTLINRNLDNTPLASISQVAFSSDNARIATLGSLGMSVFVWELPGGKELFRTPVDRGAIVTTAISYDGKNLATGHTDGTVRIWNIETGKEVLQYANGYAPYMLKFSPCNRYLASSSSQSLMYGPDSRKSVLLWNLKTKKKISLLLHKRSIKNIVFSPDGEYVATTSISQSSGDDGEKNGTVTIWKTATGRKAISINHDHEVNSIRFSPNGKFLMTGSAETSRIWELKTGNEIKRFDHTETIQLVDFLHLEESNYALLSADNKGNIFIREAFGDENERVRLFERSSIIALEQNNNQRYFVTLSYDLNENVKKSPKEYSREIRVWTIDQFNTYFPLQHDYTVMEPNSVYNKADNKKYLVTFASKVPEINVIPKTAQQESSYIFNGDGAGSLYIWDQESHKKIAQKKHPGAITTLDLSASGEFLVTGCTDGVVRVFDRFGEHELKALKEVGWINFVRLSPNGQYIAISSGDPNVKEGKRAKGKLIIWDWKKNLITGTVDYPTIFSLDFSPDNELLAAGGLDKMVHILRSADAKEIKRFAHKNAVVYLAFTRDGKKISTISNNFVGDEDIILPTGQTRLWSLYDGQSQVWYTPNSRPIAMAISSDNKYFAFMNDDGKIHLVNINTGKENLSLKHDGQAIEASLCFSADNKYLASCFGDNARVWDLSSGKEVVRRAHEGALLSKAIFSSDGKYLITVSNDSSARLWLWKPEDMIAEACRRLSGKVPNEEITKLLKH